MQTYHISNEAKGTSKSFTSKRLALKQMAQQNRDGERYNCSIYWGDTRTDNGTFHAERIIRSCHR